MKVRPSYQNILSLGLLITTRSTRTRVWSPSGHVFRIFLDMTSTAAGKSGERTLPTVKQNSLCDPSHILTYLFRFSKQMQPSKKTLVLVL